MEKITIGRPDSGRLLGSETAFPAVRLIADQAREIEAQDADAINTALLGVHSAGTRKSYGDSWRVFVRWCQRYGRSSLPARPETVAAFAVRRAEQVKPQTIDHNCYAIAQAHELSGLANPCADTLVKYTLRGIRRQNPVAPKHAPALDDASLYAIIATVHRPRRFTDKGTPRKYAENPETARARGDLDIAIALTMRDAGLRAAEASALEWKHIEQWEDGSGRCTIRRSKTDQYGAGTVVYLSRRTMKALGAIRPAVPDGRVFPFTTRALMLRIKAMAREAGLGDGFSSHSPRVGLAHKAATARAPIAEIMRQGRWKDGVMVARYTRKLEAGLAASWLDD